MGTVEMCRGVVGGKIVTGFASGLVAWFGGGDVEIEVRSGGCGGVGGVVVWGSGGVV